MANMTKGGRGRTARPRRRFSEEFKAGAVRLVIEEERSIRQVARELDIGDEHAELQQLRKRVRELEVDKAILKKAAAFFAKENA